MAKRKGKGRSTQFLFPKLCTVELIIHFPKHRFIEPAIDNKTMGQWKRMFRAREAADSPITHLIFDHCAWLYKGDSNKFKELVDKVTWECWNPDEWFEESGAEFSGDCEGDSDFWDAPDYVGHWC